MSCKKRTDEGMVNVLCATELRKGKPEYNDRLEKVVEGYASEISVITGKLDSRGKLRSQYKIVLDQYSTTLKKENTTQ